MTYTQRLSTYQWESIYKYLCEFSNIYVRNEPSSRRFVEGVLRMARSGAQWRLLPREYGDWNAVYRRFADWAEKGVWYKMLYYFANDADMEYIMIDSTILRAHACATVKKTNKSTMG
ncbi:MAG: transposase [Alphaproteobacteria bacterium]|nr:transposase [Alphaproteobacteria bacterium]